MKKFNDTGIFTGYLKQMLHDFNLPKYRVYTAENKAYHDFAVANNSLPEDERPDGWSLLPEENVLRSITKNRQGGYYDNNMRYIPYIKDGFIQEYIDGKWVKLGLNYSEADKHIKTDYEHVHSYEYGQKILNYTKNLRITNNVYDSYTHEYLGDYLRFQRDYNGINLMPLYNCFSNRTCDRLYIKTSAFEFDTDKQGYKIYMVPVKLFKKYTIAVDSDAPIELCCGLYGTYQDNRAKFQGIPALTYQKITDCRFNQPFIYSKLFDNIKPTNVNESTANSLIELAQNEDNLKLFIKLPANNTSTIVVLEGEYDSWNDSLFAKKQQTEISVDAFGHGRPSAQAAIGSTYFNVDNFGLYEYTEAADKPWKFSGYLWGALASNKTNDKITSTLSQYKPQIDDGVLKDEDNNVIEWDAKKYIDNYSRKIERRLSYADVYFNAHFKKIVINIGCGMKKAMNNAIINFETLTDEDDIALISQLQLLRANTKEQHPFADRLIEYLVGNAITGDEEQVSDNIKRAQKIMYLNSNANGYVPEFPGVWDNRMKKISYDFMNRNVVNFDDNHDILGYIDKEVEKYYTHTYRLEDGKKASVSILNAEVSEEDFR